MQPDGEVAVTEQERPLRYPQPVELSREIWHALRGHARERDADRDQARQRVIDAQDRLAHIAGDLADALHQLRGLIAAACAGRDVATELGLLDGIAARQEAALRRAGIRILDPTGEPFVEDMASWVEVRHAEVVATVPEPVVGETLRLGLLLDTGALIRPAQVLLRVPQPDSAEQSPTPEPDRSTSSTSADQPERDQHE